MAKTAIPNFNFYPYPATGHLPKNSKINSVAVTFQSQNIQMLQASCTARVKTMTPRVILRKKISP